MVDQISDTTPANGTAANPATEPAPANGTVPSNGEANGQGASVEEVFGNVDPKTLPPQLRNVYDNMLRGFKEKTTKLSETVKSEVAKATETYKQKAQFYDAFTQHEELVKQYNDYVQKLNTNQQTNPNDPNTQLQQKIQSIEVQLKTAEAQQFIDAFANAVDEKGNKINQDFDKVEAILVGEETMRDGTKRPYSLLRASVELAPGNSPQEKLANGYKAAKEVYAKIFEEGRKAGMGRLHDKARNGSLAPSSVNAGSTAPRRPKDALEALQFAKQGLAPTRD